MIHVTAILIFTAVSSFTALLLATAAGTLTVPVTWAALLAGLLAGGYGFYRSRGIDPAFPRPSRTEIVLMIFFMLICVRQFGWLYYEKGADILTLNRHGFADLHFHRALIGNFLNRTAFWPASPILVGESLNYHFGMDLFTALWAKIGMPLPRLFALLGIVFSALTLVGLFAWGRGFTVAGFLFSGGFAGYLVLQNGILKDYAMEMDLAWKNILLTLLVPQRGYLFAFPAGLTLLWSWRRRFIEQKTALPPVAEILLLGLMPFFHLHTFLVMLFVYFVWVVWARRFPEAVKFCIPVLLLSVPLIFKLTGAFQRASVIWFAKGWMLRGENPMIFFLMNFGFFAPLFLWSTVVALRERNKSAVMIMTPAWILFGISMFVMLAPWDWDNIKLISWSYLMLLPVADQMVVRRLPIYPKLALIVLLFWSGLMSVLTASGVHAGSSMMKRSVMDQACYALKDISPESRIAAAQAGYHEVLFCGHKVVAGYKGTLRSHGMDRERIRKVEEALDRLMNGGEGWREAARELGAGYLFWGKNEREDFPKSNRPWEAESLKLAAGDWGELYDLGKPSALVGPAASLNLGPNGGLLAKYFPNPERTGEPVNQGVVQSVDFKWDDGSSPLPPPFGLSLQGEILFPESGTTKFCLASDGGSRLEIGKKLILNNSGPHDLKVRCMKNEFAHGWYPFRLNYDHRGGTGFLKLWWQLPSGREEVVPPQSFRRRKT